jgi:CubicO group peptidase (beta-lactamase class C family)
MPELAAGGLWSTATDLARLLIEVGRAYRNEQSQLISRSTALGMLTRQAIGSYGLGGAVAW